MLEKLIAFFLKKKIENGTEQLSQTSKTKIFLSIEALLRAVEFLSPHFGYAIVIPEKIHEMLYALAGISYAERVIK